MSDTHIYTNPYNGLTPRKMTFSEMVRAIRLDIQAELDATNLYQAHIDAIDDERVKAVLAHIRDEEKEHAAEFTQLLAMLDPYQAQELQNAPQSVAEILSEGQAGAEAPTMGGGLGAGPRGLTVGSLMGRAQG